MSFHVFAKTKPKEPHMTTKPTCDPAADVATVSPATEPPPTSQQSQTMGLPNESRFEVFCLAEVGSSEYPKKQVVRILRCLDLPGFFSCQEIDTGSVIHVHYQKLTLLWQNPQS